MFFPLEKHLHFGYIISVFFLADCAAVINADNNMITKAQKGWIIQMIGIIKRLYPIQNRFYKQNCLIAVEWE